MIEEGKQMLIGTSFPNLGTMTKKTLSPMCEELEQMKI